LTKGDDALILNRMSPLAGANALELPAARRILVVDAHVDSADIIAEILESEGHQTRVAYHPLAAISVAAELRPDVVIIDVDLPNMDGHELGAMLRMDLPECRFIALTDDAPRVSCLRSQWAGFHGYLNKPISLAELLASVTDARLSGTFTRDPQIQR
jgi:CheY-like chemotaxis protein